MVAPVKMMDEQKPLAPPKLPMPAPPNSMGQCINTFNTKGKGGVSNLSTNVKKWRIKIIVSQLKDVCILNVCSLLNWESLVG